MFQTKDIEKIKTHILCSVTFFEDRAVYEIMWQNVVERGRPQTTIWRMRIACWIHIEVVIFNFTYVYLLSSPYVNMLHGAT